MKPKDYKRPYIWGEQFITISDGIFHTFEVRGEEKPYSFPGWEAAEVFGRKAPIKMEFCSGNGDWIAEKAASEPETNWVAVEMQFERVRRIWSKGKNRGVANLFCIAGEGMQAAERYMPTESVEEIFINFPDPWPKKRHAKYRLIKHEFLSELHRILKPGGTVTFVTDDPTYSDETISTFTSHPGFRSVYESPFFRSEREGYGTSYFEKLWRSKGLPIRYHLFGKVEVACN